MEERGQREGLACCAFENCSSELPFAKKILRTTHTRQGRRGLVVSATDPNPPVGSRAGSNLARRFWSLCRWSLGVRNDVGDDDVGIDVGEGRGEGGGARS